jgi:LPS O-antigen subunit length determinant protein (WzzB/FepE family)
MKKKSSLYDDEIDLFTLIMIIWDGKLKILLITIISFLIGFGYSYQIPNNYLNSLTISLSKNYEFTKLDNLNKLMKQVELNQLIDLGNSNNLYQSNKLNLIILEKFIDEFEYYKEFLIDLSNKKKNGEDISKLKLKDQEIELIDATKLSKIVLAQIDEKNYILNFKWHDSDEAKKIFKNILDITSNKLKKRIFDELRGDLEFKKKLILSKDRERLDYLREQSTIAKELQIIDNQIDTINVSQSSSVSLSINTADIAYYLRGYKAIDKEIELIKNRDYKNLQFIKEEINNLSDLDIKLVDYNVNLMNFKSLKNTKVNLIISILLGLIIGIFYVFISNAFKSQTASKQNS